MTLDSKTLDTSTSNAGIVGLEIYWPSMYIDQTELERHDQCSGKYTVGLGQQKMSFCSDTEDINSMCLTVVKSLLKKYNIEHKDVGRLEVGTESMVDRSKSVKTVLMSLFEESGNNDIEGVDSINGCYGATNALFNAVNWIQSSFWDGRYAIVVAGDNAVYPAGPARPTGGCGAVAILLGRDAPIHFRPPRSSYMAHVYDFYKPKLDSGYPIVHGALSLASYFKALHNCYNSFEKKYRIQNKVESFSILNDIDYVIFHAPYCKIVRKAFARLVFFDAKAQQANNQPLKELQQTILDKFGSLSDEELYCHHEFELEMLKVSEDLFDKYTKQSTFLPEQLGNLYTASVYSCLLSLIDRVPDTKLGGARMLVFSYGSGLASSMFSLVVDSSLADIKQQLNINTRLNARQAQNSTEFMRHIQLQEQQNHSNFIPSGTQTVRAGCYYLSSIDEHYRRFYTLKEHDETDSSHIQS